MTSFFTDFKKGMFACFSDEARDIARRYREADFDLFGMVQEKENGQKEFVFVVRYVVDDVPVHYFVWDPFTGKMFRQAQLEGKLIRSFPRAIQEFRSKYLKIVAYSDYAGYPESYQFFRENCDLFPENFDEAFQKLDAYFLSDMKTENIL